MNRVVLKIIVVSSFLILGLSDVWAKKQEVTPKALRAPVSMRSEYQGNIYKIKLDKKLHASVERQIERFSSGKLQNFVKEGMARAEPYLPYIMERIDYYGLPRELIYLPLVESAYRHDAVSRVGATGMWQFMYTSALPYGLVINEWQDDRLDVYLATDAALRKIRREMDLLGDPLLAMAAYNGGITRVRRHQRNLESAGEEATFWQMYDQKLLPRETSEYVPQILAIAKMMEKPRKYGFKPIKWRPRELNSGKSRFFVELELSKQIHLELIAKDAGIQPEELIYLNRALKKNITPPIAKNTPFMVRLPISYVEELTQAIEASDWAPILYKKYRVQKGDSFARIASRHNVRVADLIEANPGKNPRLIHPGDIINVPI
ncbi:lytic transglycosylase domain-containing protein [Entomospira culicis]|uniref:Transglycosylase SLT domain-containing protein n=1 Tax=Entomospira culicis TaxID=2719989 RepID=A0A968GLF2_9SPIO|nr:lytic transglycosylase domain-containing protein [Entomospira culicis]NIZ19741.1 transglycosylase SLT domain-containing protein [Entomospira culicis]NIZ69955.1 transglycosylase SLT domain-containing protein [Entomospira culicis]WDI37060.1 transglycosylase SLT domain-containing protein [Entomospira culicis]WDI38689.1 transglycosylase SLT domain-containing protein [Entomospira culicis]